MTFATFILNLLLFKLIKAYTQDCMIKFRQTVTFVAFIFSSTIVSTTWTMTSWNGVLSYVATQNEINNEQKAFTDNQATINHGVATQIVTMQTDIQAMQNAASYHIPNVYDHITHLWKELRTMQLCVGIGLIGIGIGIGLPALYDLCITQPRQNKQMQQQIAEEVDGYTAAFTTLLPQHIQSLDKQRILLENSNTVTADQVSHIIKFEQTKRRLLYSIENVLNRLEAIHAGQYTPEDIKFQVDSLRTIAQNFGTTIKAMKFHKE